MEGGNSSDDPDWEEDEQTRDGDDPSSDTEGHDDESQESEPAQKGSKSLKRLRSSSEVGSSDTSGKHYTL